MQEQCVTFKIALLLRELGFDEECWASYDINYPFEKELFQFPVRRFTNNHVKAPLWQQAWKFLLNKLKNKYQFISYEIFSDDSGTVRYIDNDDLIDFKNQEDGILKLIELAKK